MFLLTRLLIAYIFSVFILSTSYSYEEYLTFISIAVYNYFELYRGDTII